MASLRLVFVTCLAALMLVIAPSAGAIVNGSPDGNRHPFVVFVGENASPRLACSGTLIAPRVVVTAGHCAVSSGESMTVITGEHALPPTPANVYIGTFMRDPAFCGGFPIGSVFCPEGLFGLVSNDVAVVLLNRDAPGPYAKLPKLNRVGKKFDDLKQLTIVGYGLTAAPPPPIGLGTRRYAKAEAHVFTEQPDFLELPVPTSDKYGTPCFGDSGAPNLKGRTAFAVMSIADDECGGPAYAYRLDTAHARAFLANFVDLKGREGNDDDERDDG
jgi:hypothetical protein